MSQMKEQDKSPERQLNEMEIGTSQKKKKKKNQNNDSEDNSGSQKKNGGKH